MFTGIIEELGTIQGIARGVNSAHLKIKARKILQGLQKGDSIAVNGVCLTVNDYGEYFFTADVMGETLKKTNLGQLTLGRKVNLERALQINSRLGGHLVSGHIDGIGTIVKCEKDDLATLITISVSPDLVRYIIKKGSIAVDGVSLTVAALHGQNFQVSLIPQTAKLTILGEKRPGETVNLEMDLIGKYVESFLSKGQKGRGSEITLDYLAKNGFL